MTTIIGITGGIGSGKSTFSNEVIKRKIKLLDSDKIVAQIYDKPNKDFINYLKKIKLGRSVNKTKIDKQVISKLIFSNKKMKTNLENYIFKIVRKKRKGFIKKEMKNKTKTIFLDIPLLFENNLNNEFDLIISIISKRKTRFKRLKSKKNMSKNLFNKILKTQTTDLVRKNKSDIIITNNGTMKSYLRKINQTLNKVLL